ncbi:MAG: hypothetical protein C0P77_005030 [Thermoanaerobacterales bacterium]|nr:hypothetical protein [Thermoanaerobacterales bacterium]
MTAERDPGEDKVTEQTRAFEQRSDELAHGSPDRPPTPEEEAAAERAEPLDDATRRAYKEAAERGANAKGEGRI